MKRELTNSIRFFMDEVLPPLLRDSKWFMYPFYVLAYSRRSAKYMMDFKQKALLLNDRELQQFYLKLNTSVSRRRKTDLTEKSIVRIMTAVKDADSVLDAGCGKGYLLSLIKETYSDIGIVGLDYSNVLADKTLRFVQGDVKRLPFKDNEFDTVVCTHTLEHVLDPKIAIEEIKRVARKMIVIVVPKQRPYYYTLDEHVNFYPFKEILIAQIGLERHTCLNCQGDWLYVGTIDK